MSKQDYQGAGVASVGKGCRPHNKPANHRDEKHGNTIKTFCKVCGGWIDRPAIERTATK